MNDVHELGLYSVVDRCPNSSYLPINLNKVGGDLPGSPIDRKVSSRYIATPGSEFISHANK